MTLTLWITFCSCLYLKIRTLEMLLITLRKLIHLNSQKCLAMRRARRKCLTVWRRLWLGIASKDIMVPSLHMGKQDQVRHTPWAAVIPGKAEESFQDRLRYFSRPWRRKGCRTLTPSIICMSRTLKSIMRMDTICSTESMPRFPLINGQRWLYMKTCSKICIWRTYRFIIALPSKQLWTF